MSAYNSWNIKLGIAPKILLLGKEVYQICITRENNNLWRYNK